MTAITRSFIVTSQSIKRQAAGCLDYAFYLNDMEHPNHLNKTEYIQIHKSPVDIAMSAIKEASLVDLKNAKNGKGGRPTESYLQSFVFSPPKSMSLTEDQFKTLAGDVLKSLGERMGLSAKTLLANVHLSVHKQDNSHLNIIVSRNIEGQSYQQILTRPSTTNLLRRQFNASMLKFGYDFKEYKPVGKKQTLLSKLNDKELEIENKVKELKKLERINKKASNQFEKLLIAFETKNNKDIYRQTNRLNKTIDDYGTDEIYQENLKDLINSIKETEKKQNKKILNTKNRKRI